MQRRHGGGDIEPAGSVPSCKQHVSPHPPAERSDALELLDDAESGEPPESTARPRPPGQDRVSQAEFSSLFGHLSIGRLADTGMGECSCHRQVEPEHRIFQVRHHVSVLSGSGPI